MKGKIRASFVILPLLFTVLSLSVFAQTQTEESKKNDPSRESSMARAIDTSAFDKQIAEFSEAHKANPEKSKIRKKLAQSYADRGFALTNAAQYRSALGDFRRCLKLNPKNKEAREMHDQLVNIFKAIGREAPKEGEEPAPLPFNK
jgi:tetratricopeptide (TPR) repeat protein